MTDRGSLGLEIAKRAIAAKEVFEQAKLEYERADAEWRAFLSNGSEQKNLPLYTPERAKVNAPSSVGKRGGTVLAKIIEALKKYDHPVNHHDIARDAGVEAETVRPALWYLKRKNKVETPGRGLWIISKDAS